MAAPPYMKLYVGDYHGDTTHLSTVEHGAYLLLLMAMWRAGGKLPRDDRRLAALTKLSAEGWADIKPVMMEFFKVSGGSITHKRIVSEIGKYEAVVEKRARAGKASAAKKAAENNDVASTHVEQVLNTCSHNQNQKPEPEPSLEDIGSSKGTRAAKASGPTDRFDEFWKLYPRKIAKPAAHKAYLKALKETDHATLVAGLSAQISWGVFGEPEFTPHAATWLNKGRWSDERDAERGSSVATRANAGRSRSGADGIIGAIARSRAARGEGVAVPGERDTLFGDDHDWRNGAIEGEYRPSDPAGGGGVDPGFPPRR